MSSENEIANQPAENGPENDVEQDQPEANEQIELIALSKDEQTQANPEQSPLAQAEPDESTNADVADAPQEDLHDEDTSEDAEDDGWKAWIESPPEEDVDSLPVDASEVTDGTLEVELVADSEPLLEEPEIDITEEVQEPETQETTPEEQVSEEATSEETTPEKTAVSEVEDPAAETSDSPKPEKTRRSRRGNLSIQDVITYFAPCGRCGFFLSGYRAAYGRDNLETAVYEAKSGWLKLTWGMQTQDLILKSYGSRIETNDLHFDGCCSECRRAFIYKGSRSEKKPATFRIEIKPRKRQ